MGLSQHRAIVQILLLIVLCLIGVQYLSLLQVNQKKSHINRSLFTLDWGTGGDNSGPEEGDAAADKKASLLIGIQEFLQSELNGVAKEESGAELLFGNVSTASVVVPGSTPATAPTLAATNETVVVGPPLCPMIPPELHGPIKVWTKSNQKAVPSFEEIERKFPHLELGGRYSPPNCTARHRVAIIVPYREREEHLRTFLLNLHSFLKRQLVDYGIFIVEQFGEGPFNRAMLLNVGAAEALKQHNFQCFIFHDVDLLPEDDRNLYTCPAQPRHMSVAINSFLYRLPYDDIFGGVSAMTVEHFRQVNGFSNMFWGWGGEDDDMSNRLRQKKLYISRYPANIARYRMLKHSKDKANPERFRFLYSGAKRMSKDGYNSLKYKRVDLLLKRLYTWILVDLPHLKN